MQALQRNIQSCEQLWQQRCITALVKGAAEHVLWRRLHITNRTINLAPEKTAPSRAPCLSLRTELEIKGAM